MGTSLRSTFETWIGRKFYKLTVIGVINKNKRNWVWCKCECGNPNELLIQPSVLTNSNPQKSCGRCSKYDMKSGQKYGKLTIIKYHGKSSNGSLCYECKCDCGNPSTIAYGCSMRRGDTTSCGNCLRYKIRAGQR